MSDQTKTAPANSAPNKQAPGTSHPEYNANVPVDLIVPDPKNRDKIDPARIAALAENIDEIGLLQPIVLQVLPDGKYRIMAGEHRWRAVKQLKLPTIAARIYRNQSALEAAKRKAAENAMRVDLTAIEKAKRYQELQELGATQKEIGITCGGVSQPVVANSLRLLTLPLEVQELISAGELTEAHGVSLARFTQWRRLCVFIAEAVAKHADADRYNHVSVKDLNRDKVPFSYELKRRGLIEEINVVAHSWTNEVAYKIPDSLPKDNFIRSGDTVYYVLPENPKDNVWGPEKAKQDAARKVVADQQSKKNAEALKKGNPSKNQLERRKKLDENKRARTTITVTLAGAVNRLAEAKDAPSTAIQVVFEKALRSSFLEPAARMLGIKLPASEDEIEDYGYDIGLRDLSYKKLYSLSDDQLLRLAACTVMLSEASDAQRFASEVPGSVEHIAAGKFMVPTSEFEELKKEDPEWIADIERRLVYNTPGQIAKEFQDRKGVLSIVKLIKKAWLAKREAQRVIDELAVRKKSKKGAKSAK